MRPYNHPDNLLPNGQPKISEEAWAELERSSEDMAEDTGWGAALAAGLEKKADKSAIQTLWVASEKAFASRNLEHIVSDLVKKLETMPSKNDLNTISSFLMEYIEQSPSRSELLSSLSTLNSKFEKISLALTALGAKIDTDFTAQNIAVISSSLDVDYETTIQASLV